MTISRCLQGKILIVDDVPNSRELLRAVLEHLGHFVMEAAGGEEALLRFRGTTTDLIFLDLKIPPPAGYELLQTIRGDERWSSVPVSALTAQAMMSEREKALSAGFDGFLAKPVRLAAIREEVQRLLPR